MPRHAVGVRASNTVLLLCRGVFFCAQETCSISVHATYCRSCDMLGYLIGALTIWAIIRQFDALPMYCTASLDIH